MVDDDLGLREFLDALSKAGQLRPRAGVDDDERLVRIERKIRRKARFDVDVPHAGLVVDERVFPRQVRQQQHVGVDALLLHAEDEGGRAAERVAVGADVGGDEDALRARRACR